MKITKKTTRLQLAALVSEALAKENISAVLVGGAVVSIYTDNQYESKDLDFISSADHKHIVSAMQQLGFAAKGRHFFHPNTDLTVEFPSGPLGIGDRAPIKPDGEIKVGRKKVILFSPTQSVMDRLAWFYHNNDRQCLDQAVMIVQSQPVKLSEVKKWSAEEGQIDKFELFLKTIEQRKSKNKS